MVKLVSKIYNEVEKILGLQNTNFLADKLISLWVDFNILDSLDSGEICCRHYEIFKIKTFQYHHILHSRFIRLKLFSSLTNRSQCDLNNVYMTHPNVDTGAYNYFGKYRRKGATINTSKQKHINLYIWIIPNICIYTVGDNCENYFKNSILVWNFPHKIK